MLRAMDKVKENTVNLTKIKDEFVANVTHELRTPVNGILGNIQDLLSKESDESKRYTMEMIEKSCADMNYLINNILDFSKLEAGKFEIEEREFSLRAMIDYVRSNHKIKIHEKGLDFFVSVAPDIPDKLIGDELRLEQILNNLLSNAAKFTSVGKIMLEVLETGRSGNKVELFFMVVDTGIGIDDGAFLQLLLLGLRHALVHDLDGAVHDLLSCHSFPTFCWSSQRFIFPVAVRGSG